MKTRSIPTTSSISSSPVFAETGTGPVLLWGGDFLRAVSLDGRILPGWPQKGDRFFASSPSAGDVDGDGSLEIFCGNDDDRLYGWKLDGRPLPGFPIRTGGDVFSAPALADIDGDGRPEIVFGSDDGKVYVVDHEARPLPGWPRQTGHFVSASPLVADIDGDGRPEIVTGSWDRKIHAWNAWGEALPGWPVEIPHIVWSSAVCADIDGDGRLEIVTAADRLRVMRADGSHLPGFPVRTRSWMVSSPCVVDADGDGQLEIGIGSDRFYVFKADGSPAPGFPLDLGGYIWASPIAVDIDGDGFPEWIVGSWSGKLFVIGRDGSIREDLCFSTRGPIFSSAAAVQDGSRILLTCGSWDRSMHVLEVELPDDRPVSVPFPAFRGGPRRTGQAAVFRSTARPRAAGEVPEAAPAGPPRFGAVTVTPDPPAAGEVINVDLPVSEPEAVERAMLVYRTGESVHPSPMVLHRGALRAMIHPLRPGTSLSWLLEIETAGGESFRFPAEGENELSVE